MAQIIDLFKSATKNPISNEIYGNDASRIESRGLVNIPRKAALLASSPNSVADLIGNQISGVLKGSANRPSDTIFKDNKPFSKPITILNGLPIGAKEANDRIEVGTEYYVKQSPSPDALFVKLKQGASSPLNVASNTAINALRNPTGALKTIKNLARGLKAQTADTNTYGEKFATTINGNVINETTKFSTHKEVYELGRDEKIQYNSNNTTVKSIVQRENEINWDLINNNILKFDELNKNEDFKYQEKLQADYEKNKITHIKIRPYGKSKYNDTILLPGTISGLSDEFSPEWSPFRYVGSPFMQYRYVGVERSIKFNIKMYYLDEQSKNSMISTIEKLKALVFPYDELSVIQYGDAKYNPIAFSPNLIHFSISGLYTSLFGYVEELSFQIDDNISWATTDIDMSGNKTDPYPTVIDVSFGIKIISAPGIVTDANGKIQTKTYKYNFNEGAPPEILDADKASLENYNEKKIRENNNRKIIEKNYA